MLLRFDLIDLFKYKFRFVCFFFVLIFDLPLLNVISKKVKLRIFTHVIDTVVIFFFFSGRIKNNNRFQL